MTPPSLRRRAPEKIELTDSAGQPPRISYGLVHLRAGKRLRVRVVPQQAVAVHIVPSEALLAVVQPCAVLEGSVQAYHAEVVGQHRARLPLPRKASIHIAVTEPGAVPYTLLIPLAVWPALTGVLAWGVLSVGLTMVSARVAEQVRTASPAAAVLDLVRDVSFLAQTVLIGVGVAGLIHVAGWFAVRFGFLAGEDA